MQYSPTFCIMPWVHFHITQYGTVTPCCQAPWQQDAAFGNINKSTILEIWNGQEMKSFRKNQLQGKPDKRCESCYKKEQSGFTSLRQITNQKYRHKFKLAASSAEDGSLVSTKPVYFDIRFSNVCNLKCRICGPWSSSSWYTDAVQLGMISGESKSLTQSFDNTKDFFLQFEALIPDLEELYFAGGEPLMMEEHYRILELLIKKGKTDVLLTYNTNFSTFRFKNYNVAELWKKFSHINIAASLDAEGERGELLRKNIVWKDVEANRRWLLKELPGIEFTVSPTLNIYNLMHLPDFHRKWVEMNLINVEDFIPTLLIQPKAMSVVILPVFFKLEAHKKYQLHLEWIESRNSVNIEKRGHMIKQFYNVLQCLRQVGEEDLLLFKTSYESIDAVRKESTMAVFPELVALLTDKF